MTGVIGVGIFLGILGIQDLKRKQVSLLLVLSLAGFGMVLYILNGESVSAQFMAMALSGGIMGAAVILSKGAVGAGDAWVIAALGGCLGFLETISVLFYGLLFCAAAGIVLLIRKRGTMKREIPFIPFLFLGYCVWLVVKWGGIR